MKNNFGQPDLTGFVELDKLEFGLLLSLGFLGLFGQSLVGGAPVPQNL